MNGFDQRDPVRPFYFYSEQQIPNYWQYARNFVLADHFFSTTLGPSTPGHAVFWFGRSLSLDNATCNTPDGGGCTGSGCTASSKVTITSYDPDDCTTKTVPPCFDVPSLTDHLPTNFTWSDYGGPIALMAKSVAADPNYKTHFRKSGDLVADLNAGHLANLTIAHLSSGEVSEHPDAYPCAGENFTVDIVNAAMKLPQWNEMAIVITWDDWGGFYDHVAPTVHKCANGKIFNTGFRLPALIVSPYAKKGYVMKGVAEQASVPKLVEELWGMPFMTTRDPHARDGTAGSLMDAFDFAQAPRAPLYLTTHTCP
jgi:phospholipase C